MHDPAIGMPTGVLKIAERTPRRHVRQKFFPFHGIDTGSFNILLRFAQDGLLRHAGNFRETAGEVGVAAVRIHLPEPIGRCFGKVLQPLLAFVQDLIDAALNGRQVFERYYDRAGLAATVFCPADTPEVNLREIAYQGADVYRVDGLINDCGRIVGKGKEVVGWFDLSTLREPYRIEGKKTMGLELAEQFDWELPDAIFYPTGGGTGLIGMWKAFAELEAIGWIGSKRPKMFAVQSEGCAPIVRAYLEGKTFAEPWKDAYTIASGIRVPVALGDFLILRAVRDSGGAALAVSEADIIECQAEVAARNGLLLCPEGAATYAAYRQAHLDGLLESGSRVVLFNCASVLKYPMPEVIATFDAEAPNAFRRFLSR